MTVASTKSTSNTSIRSTCASTSGGASLDASWRMASRNSSTSSTATAKVSANLRMVRKRGSLCPFSSSQIVRVLAPVAFANPRAEYPVLRLERFSYRKRPWCPVAAVSEEAASILERDRTERPVGGIEERLSRSGLRLPQDALNLGERLLYGVEIR